MSILETILVFVAIPLAVFGFFALVTQRSKFAGRPRYRPGQAWDHPPVWWSAHPEGVGARQVENTNSTPSTLRGGASGNW